MQNQTIIIIGANSEIAKSLALAIQTTPKTQLIVISRHLAFYQQASFNHVNTIAVQQYKEPDISKSVETITQLAKYPITHVYICHGMLHNKQCSPEKRLEDFSAESFNLIVAANTVTPMLWLKHLTPVISSTVACKVVVFTARVGSISDNKLGGWYSYRASKAAMNMLLTSAAIELSRRAKNIKLISFHPGTTDSPLSKPFQKNVPQGKLFTSEFVAKQLLTIVKNTVVDGKASYLDWQGKTIPW